MRKSKFKNDTLELTTDNSSVLTSAVEETLQREKVKDDDSGYNLEVIKDYQGRIDPFYLSKKDAKFEYRFLRQDDKNLSIKTGNLLFQKGGWQLCPREHLKRLQISERFISPDGFYRVGDQILAFMPKELYKEKEQERLSKAKAPIDAIQRMMKHGDRDIGGSIHESMKGIQTAKDLGME